MSFRSTIAVAVMLTATAALTPPAVHAAPLAAGSSSDALSAAFTVNRKSSALAPQGLASGKTPPKYDTMVSLPSIKKSQAFDILTLSATVNAINDTASSAGAKAGTIASAAGSSIGPLSGTIASPLGTALSAHAKKLVSSAGLTKTATKNTPTAASTISGLSVNSSVFGINKTYTGSPKPNFILYQSADKAVTLYLNRQITKTTAGKVTSISVSAVNLHITKFTYSGQTVSGDLYLATSKAN